MVAGTIKDATWWLDNRITRCTLIKLFGRISLWCRHERFDQQDLKLQKQPLWLNWFLTLDLTAHKKPFLHARPWIDEYDVTMLVTYIRMTSQINCGDVTILNQKRLPLATTAKSAIDNCFGGIECSEHQIACKKWNNTFVTVNNDFWVTRDAICQWFSWKLLTNRLTRDPKIVIHGNLCIILYIYNADTM